MNHDPNLYIEDQDRFFYNTLSDFRDLGPITTGRYESGNRIYVVNENYDVVVCTKEGTFYLGNLNRD